jgi:hypothetical protein
MDEVMRRQAWDVYFASLMSMNNHPGTTQGRGERRSIEDVAKDADAMLRERDRRVKEGLL